MQAVILAAGHGSRMRSVARSKPLLALLGMPLLERVIRSVHSCGVDDIIIVSGHEHPLIESWLNGLRHRLPTHGPTLTLAYNPHWADTENGVSLLAAAPYIHGPFLLLMADHVYDRELIADLILAPLPVGGATLATDMAVNRTDIDMDDVTRVELNSDRVTVIGKQLPAYSGFDTGAFLCSPAVLTVMQAEYAQGRTSLSSAMQALADKGLLAAQPVADRYWQDVDTPEALKHAEQALLDKAAGKQADGPVARWFNRPVSKRITRLLLPTAITPNQISIIAFALGIVAALLLAIPSWWGLLLGGLLVQLASVVDGCDGELARLRLAPTRFGGWLDALLDRYADAAILTALTWHVMQTTASPATLWLGMAAVSGSFISSYSAHKADDMLAPDSMRIGRDTRSLIIAIGAILAQPLIALWIIAIMMNLVVLRRILALRRTAWATPYGHERQTDNPAPDTHQLVHAMSLIRRRVAQSPVPEDAGHAENTLQWLLRLKPDASAALRLAALAHDIERARPDRLRREDFDDYDAFKAEHARIGARMSDQLLQQAGLPASLRAAVHHLVLNHEQGGDADSDMLKDADSLSYFDHNLPLYYEREGHDATLARARWGYRRLSPAARIHYQTIRHPDAALNTLLQQAAISS